MPHKGRKHSTGAAKASKEHGDKKGSGATTSADKKAPDTTEKKTTSPTSPTSTTSPTSPTSPGTCVSPGAQGSASVAASKKQPTGTATATKESTMKPTDSKKQPTAAAAATKESTTKPADSKGSLFSKTEPAQSTKQSETHAPRQKDQTGPKSPTKASGTTAPIRQPSTGKGASSQDVKSNQTKQKEEPKTKGEKPSVVAASSKSAAEVKHDKKPAASGAAAVAAVGAAGAVGAATAAVVSSKKSLETKEDKKQVAAAPSAQGGIDDALDELIDTLGGPEEVPESPKYTGPVVSDPASSTHIDKLGERDSTIPPEYRHLLDGKDGSGIPPKVEDTPTQPMGDDDLVEALSSGFTCASSPDKKKPKLEEGGMDDALDELMGTLEGPGENLPETPTYTGPVITETNTATHIEELGKRESTIPPAYRNLLDGKVDGKTVPPPKPETPMSDAELADQLSQDFACTPSPAVQPALPGKPEQSIGDDDLVSALSSDITCSAPPDEKKQKIEGGGIDDALDELMGTLEGPGENVPESPVYTGPTITETATSTYIEELGKRDSTIPPEYRHLLDGKEDGKVVPPPKVEPLKPMSDAELAEGLDFACSPSPPVKPTTPSKPKDTVDQKMPKVVPSEEVTTCATVSAVHSAAAPAKTSAAPAKTSAAKAPGPSDPLDALADTLGKSEPKPADTKPAVDKVKEKTGKENVEKLGERDDTIPPDYRLEELKDKDGKPILPTPEAKPKPLSETDLIDAFSEGFVTATGAKTQCASLPASKDAVKSKPVPTKEVVSSSAASTAASPPPVSKVPAPADPLDTLAGTLGKADPAPKDSKPAVDKVKEKSKKEKGEKLGERDDTIPPEHRLTEVKDKDGKPMLPKPEAKPKPMSDTELLDGLTEGFVTSPSPVQSAPLPSTKKDGKKSSVAEEVVSCSSASAVQASAPLPSDSDVNIPDDAFDLLSGTLGTREPDPEENKPMVDKVKEKAKAEHIDKLGERDDTIPPEYRHLLDGDDKNKPVKPVIPEKPKKPQDDTSAIDALSEGFCAATPAAPSSHSAKDKSGKESTPSKPACKDDGKVKDLAKDKSGHDATTTKPATKDEGKGPEKTKVQSSSVKSDAQKTSKS